MVNKIHSKQVKVGKLDIRYLNGGEGDPLIVIHGGGGGASAWLQNAMDLSRYYTVYIPDLPGFGHSQSMSDNFSLSEFVAFLEEFSHNLGLKHFHLMGHSIGGCIALDYALKFPHKVRRLVLVSSFCLGKEIALWVRFLSHPAFGRSLGEAALAILKAARWLVRLFCGSFQFVNPVSRLKIDIGKSSMTLKGQTRVLLSRLSELTVPTLLVWGAKDGIVPVSQAYAATQLIPNCQLQVFEGCGHSVYKQKAKEFSQLLASFLS
ncbi:MAG: alpha/beta fold hydrolase [Dehalococcoidia bacterium]|nr:MAG: alpha/beta fold hydrolase [Dehalococcoidia bacterium]